MPGKRCSKATPCGSAPIRAEPMGTRLIDSMPPAMTMSYAPAEMPWAAKWTACWLEPQRRSTMVHGTCTGYPAASQAVRPTGTACSPAWLTQPMIRSSTIPGSSLLRSTRPTRTCNRRSAGWTEDSAPPILPRPMGDRTISTMTGTLDIGTLPRLPRQGDRETLRSPAYGHDRPAAPWRRGTGKRRLQLRTRCRRSRSGMDQSLRPPETCAPSSGRRSWPGRRRPGRTPRPGSARAAGRSR